MARYGTRGTAFDFSDVRAVSAQVAHLDRQARRALDQSRTAYRRGWSDAMDALGADVTITDGVPVEVEEG